MSTQAVSNGFTGDTTPIQHSEQQITKPTIDCTDVAEDVISKGTSAKDKKLGKVTTTIQTQQHQLQTIIYASTAMTEELKKQPQKQQQGDNVYPTDNINNSHDATTVAHHQNHSTTVKEIY